MRKFLINVNGSSYEVEVEEIKDGVAAPAPRAAAPAAAPAPVAATAAKAAAPAAAPAPKAAAAPISAPAGAKSINAPMPGTILKVNVAAGASIKKGEVLCILEAMKMENEIMSGFDGKIVSVGVNQGDSVNTGQVLFVLE